MRFASSQAVENASDVAEELLEKAGEYQGIPYKQFPQFYLFSNARRAIVVTPFSLPQLGDAQNGPPEAPEMFGAVTQDNEVVLRVAKVHAKLGRADYALTGTRES